MGWSPLKLWDEQTPQRKSGIECGSRDMNKVRHDLGGKKKTGLYTVTLVLVVFFVHLFFSL